MKITPRASGDLRCPYCHDDVNAGPACSGCGARYHEECAQIFGACAVRACAGELRLAALAPQVLPRLAGLARRVGRCEVTGLQALGEGGPRMLILDLPCPVAVRKDPERAARVVGELLGQTPYDGRMRVLSPFPEPLIRVRSPDEAARVRARLAEVGLASITPLVEDVIRPFTPFCVLRYDLGADSITLESTQGERAEIRWDQPRLVVTSGIVIRTAPHAAKLFKQTGYARYGRGRRPTTAASKPRDRREHQLCAYVFTSAQARPFLFLHRELEPFGKEADRLTVPEGIRFKRLVDALVDPNDPVQRMPEVMCSSEAFLVPMDNLGKKRTNGPFVALLARLNAHLWQAGKARKAGRP